MIGTWKIQDTRMPWAAKVGVFDEGSEKVRRIRSTNMTSHLTVNDVSGRIPGIDSNKNVQVVTPQLQSNILDLQKQLTGKAKNLDTKEEELDQDQEILRDINLMELQELAINVIFKKVEMLYNLCVFLSIHV